MRMVVHRYLAVLVLLQMIILLFWPMKTSSEKLSCLNECGNVTIRYPFGVGKGCYFDKSFEVICVNSSKAFLASVNNLELSGNYAAPTVGVNIPIIPLLNSGIGINLSGSPFTFSASANRFTAIGCNDYVATSSVNYLINTSYIPDSGGCLSICTCDPDSTLNANCYDFLCTLPPNIIIKVFNSDTSQLYSQNITKGCKSVSIVEEGWLLSNYLKNPDVLKDKQEVPALLQWGAYKGSCSEEFTTNTTCNLDNSGCLKQLSSSYFCVCYGSSVPGRRYCSGDLICNATSSYNCSKCPDGYYSNPNSSYCNQRTINNEFLDKKSVVKFVIIGCSSGLGLLFLLVGVWWQYKFVKRRREIKLKQYFFKRNGGLLLEQELSSNEGNIDRSKLFPSKELEKATDNYNANRILGQGGQGTVYKGMLADGIIVAVKKSKIVDESNVEQFINEVAILSQINHRNVVKLFGCCLETEVPLLVYEFIPNGTLFQYIHDQTEEFPLTWEMRLRIAVEVSGALSYLHSAASIPIYHRDIKSANILLDDKYRAKVADFGASRSVTVDQTHLTTQVQGTFGYVDPEYFRSSQFTEKSDVYSFGVVLVELLTGQKPIRSINSEEDRSLAGYFLQAMKDNRLFEILDARVLEAEKEEITAVGVLAKRCLNLNGKKRPTMVEVAFELAGIRASNGANSVMQQNIEEFDFVDGGINGYFETGPSSTNSFVSSAAFSLEVVPSISGERR